MNKLVFLVVAAIFFLAPSCTNDSAVVKGDSNNPSSSSKKLFELIPSSTSGVDFQNNIIQDGVTNVFSYNYILNGGGVATADFNNDGLVDIFFTSNQESDRLYLNKGNFAFDDITEKAGIGIPGHGNDKSWSSGVTVADVNQDGWMDIYVSKTGPYTDAKLKQNLLFINNKDLTFTESSKEYGVNDNGHTTQATFFDYDRDGDLDLYVMNHSILFFTSMETFFEYSAKEQFLKNISGHLYRNDGATFKEVTEEAGLMSHTYGLGCVATDLNNDGWIDLYTTSDYAPPDHVFINKNGKFVDEIKEYTNHTSFFAMGVDAADINNDGLVDISVMDMTPPDRIRSKTLMASMDIDRFFDLHEKRGFQYQYMINTLQLNQGMNKFSEISQLAGVNKTDWSWATLLADYDNDGLKDMYVTNGFRYDVMDNDFLIEIKARQRELNTKTFEPAEAEKWLKKLPSNKVLNFAFKNKGNLKFDKVNEDWGLEQSSFSNGAAYADFDNDGDLDLAINNVDEKAFIYRNTSSDNKNNNFININLIGKKPNINGLNAKVKLYIGDDIQYQELTMTRGFQSACEKRLNFGIGKATNIDKIEVVWPDGKMNVINNTPANQFLEIKKADASSNFVQHKNTQNIFKKKDLNLFTHKENEYNDYDYELLLPHKNSQHGPKLAVGDINGDKIEDFYIGGAIDQSGVILIGSTSGKFKKINNADFNKDKSSEDLDAHFFDADQDGDLDLYVVSGGNEFPEFHPALQDRLYINNGKGSFTRNQKALPQLYSSGSKVISFDADLDGDLDLFVAGRMIPRKYPNADRSALLINEDGKFKDKTLSMAKGLLNPGILTSAFAKDMDGDKRPDLVIAGEWTNVRIFKNTIEGFTEITKPSMEQYKGWWSSLHVEDIDGDGDQDIIAGNLGLNYKYKASQENPFHIYSNDFDKNKSLDIVLATQTDESVYPLRGRECSSEQMPFIKDKFPTYKSFASADINDVYGEALNESLHLTATDFASCIFKNKGNGEFEKINLPQLAQISCVNSILFEDFDKDGNKDILLAGNLFVSEVETPRNDAGVGTFLKGNGKGDFIPFTASQSGFFVPGDVKDIKLIRNSQGKMNVLVANNNSEVEFFEIK